MALSCICGPLSKKGAAEYRLGGKKASILPNIPGLGKSLSGIPGMDGPRDNIDVKEIEKWIGKLP